MTASNFISSISDNPIHTVNQILASKCGVNDFFIDKSDLAKCIENRSISEINEYGDWQTNLDLAIKICQKLKSKGYDPQVVIEPTCGKGNFIIAALMVFDNIQNVYGIEIYKPYIDEVKYQILQFYLNNESDRKPEFNLYNANFFEFDMSRISKEAQNKDILILGNPPWVTNGKLGEMNSNNLPIKSNFKEHTGLEAITGKGNFDISEYITIQLVKTFSEHNTKIALLLKNSVIKNIVQEQYRAKFPIASMEQFRIDANKEFDVAVEAALFCMRLGGGYSLTCNRYDFYTNKHIDIYGWVNDRFVSNINNYNRIKIIDGISQLTWWSGVKHDCAKVMELEKIDGKLINGLKEISDIESGIIYPLVKSSDLQTDFNLRKKDKYIIITQRNTSDDTKLLKHKFPLAYQYLEKHSDRLDKRGSRIYKGRPRFCIFGIGDYSFAKYKVGVSGLYKTPKFKLLTPIEGKAVMLDDTCYALGFNDLTTASITCRILNHDIVQRFIESIMFRDAKRPITKDLLMRIDIVKAAEHIGADELGISTEDFDVYMDYIKGTDNMIQGKLF